MKATLRKLRRKSIRKFNKGFEELEGLTLHHAHRFILSRWQNLREVRRRAITWVIFVFSLALVGFWQSAQLNSLYSAQVPAEETTYTEGVFGAADNFNPIFASSPAEKSVSRLLFAQLLAYDEHNDIVGELAQSWSADVSGKVYTVALRPDIRWHDGENITAEDVVFTFNTIKNADTKSPLYSSWRDIAIQKVDDHTVKFTLPNAYAPFPNALVQGILPEHILGKILPSAMRNNGYNREPTVASGPFMFTDIHAIDPDKGHYVTRMAANREYFRGEPKLNGFNLHSYADSDQLLGAFRNEEVEAVSNLSTQALSTLGKPEDFVHSESPLYNTVFSFFKTSNPVLQDAKVRQALELATDQKQLISKLDKRVEPATGPLTRGQLGYNPDQHQADFNLDQANKLLDQAGWQKGSNGKRTKDGKTLALQMVTLSTGDYPLVIQELMNQWQKLGVSFNSQLVRPDDFQQNIILPRAYDVLIYEVALGKDPDEFAYWHSSQANDRGLNLSDYKSTKVDDALDSARSKLDPALREIKYHAFVQQWLADTPAIALYRPSSSYVQSKNTTSYPARPLIDQADRYDNVLDWSSAKVWLRPTL